MRSLQRNSCSFGNKRRKKVFHIRRPVMQNKRMKNKESEMKMGKKKAEKKFTFIDLFAGCGGLMEFSL